MNRDLAACILALIGIPPEAYAADEASPIIDTQGADSLTILAEFGATVEAGATLVIEAGDEADLSDAVALTPTSDGPAVGEYLYGPDLPDGETDTLFKWAYVGPYRYVRVTLDIDGATDAAVQFIKGHLSDEAAVQP